MLRTEKVVDLISDVKEGVVGLSVDFVMVLSWSSGL